MRNQFFIIAFLLIHQWVVGQTTPEIRDDKPGNIRTTFTVGKNVFQASHSGEYFIGDLKETFSNNSKSFSHTGITLENIARYGLLENLDVIGQYTFTENTFNHEALPEPISESINSFSLRTRYRFLDPVNKGFSGAAELGWNFNNEYFDASVMLGYHYNYHHLHLNLSTASKIIYQNTIRTTGAAFQYSLRMKKLNLSADYKINTLSLENFFSESQSNNMRVSAGYKLTNGFQLSLYGGWRNEMITELLEDRGTYFGLGISWRLLTFT